jgi:hypothetical protein
MPQKTMNKTRLEFSEIPIAKAPISVEAYADELMDDIFSDVDRVIQGESRLPKEAVKPEFVSLKSIKVPQIILPPMPHQEEEDKEKLRDASVKKSSPSLDRILLIAAFSSLFITLLLWLATRGGLGRLFAPEPVAVSPEPVLDAKTKANVQFSNYIERSLTNIEQQNPQTGLGLPLLPPPVANAPLPTLPVPGTPPTVAASAPVMDTNNLVAAINRVAGAIQDASNQTASLSQQVMNSLAKGQQPAPPAPVTVPGGRGSGSVPAAPPKTTTSAPPTQKLPATPSQVAPPAPQVKAVAPESSPLPPPPAVTETPAEQPTAVNPAPVIAHTLVGILELGDRSAALFEINGVARRIYVGETVGASGWSLVEVANQQAIIRRNGEVKTIFVGQQF